MARLRPVLRLALVLSLVLSTQGLLFVQGMFLLRQDVLIETLCVNRDRPEMNCDGKCFLSKQLHEHREREQEQGAASLEVMLAVGWLVGDGTTLPEPPARTEAYASSLRPIPTPPFTGDVFRPPRT